MTSRWDDLAERARTVLDANWMGGATKPGPRLYPHQWSWDSAFIAIGNRHARWDRAVLELETLFDAQWSNGLVAHIVFSETTADYFPNAEFWDSQASDVAPQHVATSGIIQPPIHATAVWRVAQAGPPEQARLFLQRMYPRLVAWHDYLYTHRTRHGVAEVWHPWETGMDNSPAWDEPLAHLNFSAENVPPYKRVDNEIAAPMIGPPIDSTTNTLTLSASCGMRATNRPTAAHCRFEFKTCSSTACWLAPTGHLMKMAMTLGEETRGHRALSLDTRRGIALELWSDQAGMYVNRDLITGQHIERRICGGLIPMFIDPRFGRILMETLHTTFMEPVAGGGSIVPSVPVDDPEFDGRRYWRGPAWPQINWLVWESLHQFGHRDQARSIEEGILNLAHNAGLWEYWDPTDGSGHGSDDFSWTAAVVLDILERRRRD